MKTKVMDFLQKKFPKFFELGIKDISNFDTALKTGDVYTTKKLKTSKIFVGIGLGALAYAMKCYTDACCTDGACTIISAFNEDPDMMAVCLRDNFMTKEEREKFNGED